MGYGLAWYGLTWYGLSNRSRTSVQVGARVAELRVLPLAAGGVIAQARSSSIPAAALISTDAGRRSIPARGLVMGARLRSIRAVGAAAARRSASIRSGAWISFRAEHVIQACGRVSAPGTASVAVAGRVTGCSSHAISASGSISSAGLRSCTVRGAVSDSRSFEVYAIGKVAAQRSAASPVRGHVCGYAYHSAPAGGTVSRQASGSISAGGLIGGWWSSAISSTGRISLQRRRGIQSGGRVALAGSRAGVSVRGVVTRPQHRSIVVGGLVIASPYYSLNGWNLTGQMLEGLKASGPEPRFERLSFRGRLDSRLVDQGYSPMEYSFEVHFSGIDEAFDYVRQMQGPGDGRFYPGDSAYFHRVRAISTERVRRRGRYMFVIKTRVYLEKPYLYSDQCSEWSLSQVSLPRTSGDFTNRGHIDMPPELVRIVGRYGSAHVKGLRLSIMDGVREEASLRLSERLLSDETLELDGDGVLRCTYSDDFETCTRFLRDTIHHSASCSSGRVTIGSSGYVVYEMRGAWPLMESMRLTATLRVLEGSPVIEVSTDGGATYVPVVASQQIQSGMRGAYYLAGTAGYRNVLVRFRCGSSDSLEIDDLELTCVRRVSPSLLPRIPAGGARQVRISDDPDSGHLADICVRFREARLPV